MPEPFSEVKFFCLDATSFEALTDKIVNYVRENNSIKDDIWVAEKRQWIHAVRCKYFSESYRLIIWAYLSRNKYSRSYLLV